MFGRSRPLSGRANLLAAFVDRQGCPGAFPSADEPLRRCDADEVEQPADGVVDSTAASGSHSGGRVRLAPRRAQFAKSSLRPLLKIVEGRGCVEHCMAAYSTDFATALGR